MPPRRQRVHEAEDEANNGECVYPTCYRTRKNKCIVPSAWLMYVASRLPQIATEYHQWKTGLLTPEQMRLQTPVGKAARHQILCARLARDGQPIQPFANAELASATLEYGLNPTKETLRSLKEAGNSRKLNGCDNAVTKLTSPKLRMLKELGASLHREICALDELSVFFQRFGNIMHLHNLTTLWVPKDGNCGPHIIRVAAFSQRSGLLTVRQVREQLIPLVENNVTGIPQERLREGYKSAVIRELVAKRSRYLTTMEVVAALKHYTGIPNVLVVSISGNDVHLTDSVYQSRRYQESWLIIIHKDLHYYLVTDRNLDVNIPRDVVRRINDRQRLLQREIALTSPNESPWSPLSAELAQGSTYNVLRDAFSFQDGDLVDADRDDQQHEQDDFDYGPDYQPPSEDDDQQDDYGPEYDPDPPAENDNDQQQYATPPRRQRTSRAPAAQTPRRSSRITPVAVTPRQLRTARRVIRTEPLPDAQSVIDQRVQRNLLRTYNTLRR